MPMPLVTKVCQVCGEEFLVRACVADIRINCSRSCYANARNTRMTRNCLECGEPFEFKPHEALQRKYCSWECHTTKIIKLCPVCGETFPVKRSKGSTAVYCSIVCMGKDYNRNIEKPCIVCGKKFNVPNNQWRKDAKYCSVPCSKVHLAGENHWNWKNLTLEDRRRINREYREKYYQDEGNRIARNESLRKQKLKRRAVLAGHSFLDWIELLKKHDNKCYYCSVRMTKKHGPIQRTRDHNISLFDGGSDTINNIVPACRSCNSRKGKKAQAEFIAMLIEEGIWREEDLIE